MNPCEFKAQLTAYLLGELPEREAAALSAHLAACPECRATADELRATLALLNQALAPAEGADSEPRLDDARRQRLLAVRPARPRNRLARWFLGSHPAFRMAIAAGLAIAVVLGVLDLGTFSVYSLRPRSKAFQKRVMFHERAVENEPVEPSAAPKSGTALGLGDSPGLAGKDRSDADAAAAALPQQPTSFDSVSMVKSPVIMRSLYASRGKGEGGGGLEKKSKESVVAGREDILSRDQSKADEVSDVRVEILEKDEKSAAPEGTVRLNIALPKPRFSGTPKDIRSPNLETAQDRRDEYARVSGVAKASEESKALAKQRPEPPPEPESPIAGGRAAANRLAVGQLAGEKKASQVEAKPAEKGYAHAAATASPVLEDAAKADQDEGGAVKQRLAETPAAAAFNPFVAAAAEPFSTFAMDVDTASYTLTRQALRAGAMPEPERVRTEEIVNAFDYGDTAPERAVFRVYQDGAQSPFGAGYHLLRIGVKGRRLGREEQRPAMLTFVVDVSGSMAQPDRIGLARLALTLLLDQLAERDLIQMIAYSDQARVVLEPVAASEKAAILAAFERLQCNGSTNLEEGLRQAYEQAARGFVPGAENRVILISDGVANLGAGSAQEILDKVSAYRKQGITCSVFGVGAGTYNDRMLEELANKGDGVYRFLDSAEEARAAFVDDLAATLNTIAKDAKIQVEWNPGVVRQYRQLGYENRALRKEQFRDDAADAGEVGSGQSVAALYELELAADAAPESRLGTVRVRYQRTDTGKVEEIEAPLLAASVLRPAHAAGPRFRVAACAAEFAELLRVSPFAAGGRFQDVADFLRPAALELALDTRVKELLDLITAAAAIKDR